MTPGQHTGIATDRPRGNNAAPRVWNSAPRRIETKAQFSGVGGLRTYISFKHSAFQ
jgi:hypothetical protein